MHTSDLNRIITCIEECGKELSPGLVHRIARIIDPEVSVTQCYVETVKRIKENEEKWQAYQERTRNS